MSGWLALWVTAMGAVTGCARKPLASRGDIAVISGYAFPVVGGGQSAFVTLHNSGALPDTVVGFGSRLAARVMLHRTEVSGGMARMAETQRLLLAPGQTVAMASGRLHLMLSGVTRELAPGDSCPLELVLATAGRLDVSVPVIAFGAEP